LPSLGRSEGDASRLACRWLHTIVKNAHDFNGVIPEKYNVVTGSHEVFVEYGNVGAQFDYILTEGFGWMNASFEADINFLSPEQPKCLHRPEPPPQAGASAHCSGARLCEPQRVNGRVTWKLVPTSILPATCCGSQTRAPAETGVVPGRVRIAPAAPTCRLPLDSEVFGGKLRT